MVDRAETSGRTIVRGVLGLLTAGFAAGLLLFGCSLGNISADSCEVHDECVLAFGLGSLCNDGYCSEPRQCQTGHSCRREFGGGACVEGVCVDTFPLHEDCFIFEPDNLPDSRLTGDDSPIILGAIFSLAGTAGGNDFDEAQIAAIRLGIRGINKSGGGNEGRKMALVACDNDGPNNDVSSGLEREQRNKRALDYLAGTLGVPAIAGPLSSNDATILVGHMLSQQYPTLLMSSSATSPALTDIPDRLESDDQFGLFWRTCPSDKLQGKVLAVNVIGVDPLINTVEVVYVDDSYGQGLADVFTTNYLAGDPGHIVMPRPYDPGMDSYADIAAKVDEDNPDAILIISVEAPDTITLLNDLAITPQVSKKYFFTDGSKDKAELIDNPNLSPEVMAIIQSARGTGPPSPVNNPNYQQFDAALDKDFNLGGNDFGFMANSYDAAFLLGMGVVYASNGTNKYDGREVAAAFARVTSGEELIIGPTSWGSIKSQLTSGGEFDLRGISGQLDFDPVIGEAPGPIEVWRVNAEYTEFEEDFTVQPM